METQRKLSRLSPLCVLKSAAEIELLFLAGKFRNCGQIANANNADNDQRCRVSFRNRICHYSACIRCRGSGRDNGHRTKNPLAKMFEFHEASILHYREQSCDSAKQLVCHPGLIVGGKSKSLMRGFKSKNLELFPSRWKAMKQAKHVRKTYGT